MPTPRLLFLIAIALFVPTAFVGQSLAAPQIPDTDVELPPLPKADEVAKFKMTVHGQQDVTVDYKFEVPSPECSIVQRAAVSEDWHYFRGKKVVIEFRRYGDNVFISREGRRIGDLSFGTTGELTREASGTVEDCRGTFTINQSPDCDETFDVTRNLQLSYQGGVIAVEPLDRRSLPRNPAEQCGIDSDVLSPEYPSVIKSKAALSAKQVFGAKKGINLKLKGKAVQPFPPAYTTINRYSGEAILELTLTRIPPKK